MNLKKKKRIASQILKCGISKVWIDPERQEEVDEAITKNDIRSLIKKGVIAGKKKKHQSRGKAREKEIKKKEGRRSGIGSRKGSKKSRRGDKEIWIKKVRGLREEIKELRDKEMINSSNYRNLYKMIKGNFFRRKSHLYSYLKEKGILEK